MRKGKQSGPDLFGSEPEPSIYNGKAPHVAGSSTSEEAAESMEEVKGAARKRVLECIAHAGMLGRIADEIEALTEMQGSTIRPRLRELQDMDCIVQTHMERKTRSGRNAKIYVTAEDYAKLIELGHVS